MSGAGWAQFGSTLQKEPCSASQSACPAPARWAENWVGTLFWGQWLRLLRHKDGNACQKLAWMPQLDGMPCLCCLCPSTCHTLLCSHLLLLGMTRTAVSSSDRLGTLIAAPPGGHLFWL